MEFGFGIYLKKSPSLADPCGLFKYTLFYQLGKYKGKLNFGKGPGNKKLFEQVVPTLPKKDTYSEYLEKKMQVAETRMQAALAKEAGAEEFPAEQTLSYLDFKRNNNPVIPCGKNRDWILDIDGKVTVRTNVPQV